MDISFVLLTWNSEKYIDKCLSSLLNALCNEKFSYEIFIVDNGSADATVSIIKSFQNQYVENIKPIFLDRNTGTTYSRNLALKQTEGRYIAIMDSDVEITDKGTIAELIKTLETDARIGLAAPRLLYPNGNLQKSVDVFPTVFTKLYRYFFLKSIEKKEHIASHFSLLTSHFSVDYAISAVWMMKKEVLKTVGILDENIFYSPEDVDYCLRLWKAGYKIVYNPHISAIHHTQEISRGLKINKATFSHIKGLIYYFKKHGYFLKRPSFPSRSFGTKIK